MEIGKEEIKRDFKFAEDDKRILAVLLYGSQVKGNAHERSDVDICIVAPDAEPREVMKDVWNEVGTEKYDIHTFEELPLKIKKRIIDQHEVIWTGNEPRLKDYLHRYRKIWNDTAKAKGVA